MTTAHTLDDAKAGAFVGNVLEGTAATASTVLTATGGHPGGR